MTDELDTEYTHEIVCPYCEYEYTHSDEYKSLIQHCISCQKCFLLDIHHKITYSSKRAPCLNGESDHDYEPFGNCNNYLCIICGQLEENPTKTEFNNIGLKGHRLKDGLHDSTIHVMALAEEQMSFLSMSIEKLEKWIQDNKDTKDYFGLNMACNALSINKKLRENE